MIPCIYSLVIPVRFLRNWVVFEFTTVLLFSLLLYIIGMSKWFLFYSRNSCRYGLFSNLLKVLFLLSWNYHAISIAKCFGYELRRV